MRWIALWLLLTSVYIGGWALVRWIAGSDWTLTAETLAHFALVPPAQVAALWVVAAVRRAARLKGQQGHQGQQGQQGP